MPTMPNVIGQEWQEALTSMVATGARMLPLGYFLADPVTILWASGHLPGVVFAQTPAPSVDIVVNGPAQLSVGIYPVSVSNYGGDGS